jgi:tRNA(fMet)-specific endonuclease VapC
MKYLLDTNICIFLIKRKPEHVIKRLLRQNISDVGISSITLSELEYGVERSAYREQNKLALATFIAPLTVFPYDDRAAFSYGRIRAVLEREGIPIGPLDTLIGAHAVSLKAILVTSNDREFQRIPGLRLENWTR